MANITSLCVYCGSSRRGAPSHHDAARQLGEALATNGIRLVYGGGRVGLMGIVADTVLRHGGEVVGVIPKFLEDLEVGHSECTEMHVTSNMHDRKLKMAMLSDAFAVLPGGFGTLDETFEILTWKQLELHDKPIVLVNIDGFWDQLTTLIDAQIEANYGRARHREMYTVAENVADVLPTIRAMPPARFSLESKWL